MNFLSKQKNIKIKKGGATPSVFGKNATFDWLIMIFLFLLILLLSFPLWLYLNKKIDSIKISLSEVSAERENVLDMDTINSKINKIDFKKEIFGEIKDSQNQDGYPTSESLPENSSDIPDQNQNLEENPSFEID